MVLSCSFIYIYIWLFYCMFLLYASIYKCDCKKQVMLLYFSWINPCDTDDNDEKKNSSRSRTPSSC